MKNEKIQQGHSHLRFCARNLALARSGASRSQRLQAVPLMRRELSPDFKAKLFEAIDQLAMEDFGNV